MELKIIIEKDLSNNKRFIIRDQSEWGIVPEGGTEANPVRNSRNLVLLIDRYSGEGYDPLPRESIVADGSPETAGAWEINVEKDGYYRIVLVSVPDHDPALTYTRDSVAYNRTDEKLYQAVDELIPADELFDNGYFWAPVESTADFPIMADTGADVVAHDHVHDLQSRLCLAEKALNYAKNDCTCPDNKLREDYMQSLLYHHASIYSGAFGEFEESGKFLDQVIDRCTEGSNNEKDCGCG